MMLNLLRLQNLQINLLCRTLLLSRKLFIFRFYIFAIDVGRTISSTQRVARHSCLRYLVSYRELVSEPSSLCAGLAADYPLMVDFQQFTLFHYVVANISPNYSLGSFTKSPPLSADKFNSAKGCTTPLCRKLSVCVVASIK